MLFICNSSAICPLNIRLTVVESQKYAYEFRKNHSQLRKICVNLNRQKYYPQFNRNHVLTNRIQCVLVEHCFVGDKTRTSISVEEIFIFKKHNSNRIFLIQYIEIYFSNGLFFFERCSLITTTSFEKEHSIAYIYILKPFPTLHSNFF